MNAGPAANVSIKYGFQGPLVNVDAACSTAAHSVGYAFNMIRSGSLQVAVTGAADCPFAPAVVAAWVAMRALSSREDCPAEACRPFSADRDGLVLGEGAGVLVLEEYEHAKRRGAKIYAEVKGYGLSGDAHHITAPAEDGDGGFRAMQAALRDAGLTPADIEYVNAHGTSTPLGDEIELKAVERLFGDSASKLSLSSTKSAIGHLLGAAGAVEAIFCALAIRDGVIPPTLNLDNPSVQTAIDLTPHKARKRAIKAAMSNSFGFGGTNAALIITAVD
jgi:3-oxoacyl-[acyl-carrier-protein] synthase II